jgi:uncharacterized protein (DUF1330 family)
MGAVELTGETAWPFTTSVATTLSTQSRYNHPAYQEAKRIRQASTKNVSMVLVEEFSAG